MKRQASNKEEEEEEANIKKDVTDVILSILGLFVFKKQEKI